MIDPIKVQARSILGRDPSFVRVLRWYEKSGDRLAGEALLDSLMLPELQRLFRESSDNLMVDCYPVSAAQVAPLQAAIDAKRNGKGNAESIDLDVYDYYLECDAV
ncbi:DUF7683 domain-containing protein [Phormidesmis sp. 146-33]